MFCPQPVTEAELGLEETVIRERKNISKKINGSNEVKVLDGLDHWHITTVKLQPSCCKSASSWLSDNCFPCEHRVLADEQLGSLSPESQGLTKPHPYLCEQGSRIGYN